MIGQGLIYEDMYTETVWPWTRDLLEERNKQTNSRFLSNVVKPVKPAGAAVQTKDPISPTLDF